VGNFLIVIPVKGETRNAERLFRNGLIAAREIRGQIPGNSVATEWALAASFPRYNGSGGSLVTDPETGSWILSTGTWFHAQGYSSGAESKLLQRYLERGATRLAQELEGFFVLILGDARRREVIVLTDIIGSCHCFQRTFDVGTVLSGSSLLLAALEDCKLDLTACQEFFCTGIIYEDRTCHQQVRKLAPATIFQFAEGKERSEERYWQAANARIESQEGDQAVEALWDATVGAAKRINSLYANPVCDLTGGYDSRALVAAFLGAGVRFATAVSGPADSADVRISRGLAQSLGLANLHSEPLKQISFKQVLDCLPLTDGEYDLVNYAEIREIHTGLSQQFDISINGSFGEVARGYWWELLFPRIGARSPLDAHKVAQRRYAAQRCDSSIFPVAARVDLVEHLARVIERTNSGLTEMPNTFQMDNAYLMMRMQRWQGRIASSTNQIWPCLSPFMFRSVLEIMLGARAMLRWRSLMVRKMLSEFSPRLAEYPLEHGFPAEPTTWKNFYRFFPLAIYFGEKVTHKIRSKLGLRGSAKTDVGDARMELWRQEEVKEFLRPEKMELNRSLDSTALAGFLMRSQQEAFGFGEQWARILSLECALQAIKRARSKFA
jgi:asparagine synthase (glutamine-hydrolysing)